MVPWSHHTSGLIRRAPKVELKDKVTVGQMHVLINEPKQCISRDRHALQSERDVGTGHLQVRRHSTRQLSAILSSKREILAKAQTDVSNHVIGNPVSDIGRQRNRHSDQRHQAHYPRLNSIACYWLS